MKFEYWLSISVLRDLPTSYKTLKMEIEKFLKKSNVLKLRSSTEIYTLRSQIPIIHVHCDGMGVPGNKVVDSVDSDREAHINAHRSFARLA
jgi:hypothetical protein